MCTKHGTHQLPGLGGPAPGSLLLTIVQEPRWGAQCLPAFKLQAHCDLEFRPWDVAQAQHQARLCRLTLKASSQPSRWGAAGPPSRALARLAADTSCSQQGELVIWLESLETGWVCCVAHGKGCCQIKLMLGYMLLWPRKESGRDPTWAVGSWRWPLGCFWVFQWRPFWDRHLPYQ